MEEKEEKFVPFKYIAVRVWDDGSEETVEYFRSLEEALSWISRRKKSKLYDWCVGEYE